MRILFTLALVLLPSLALAQSAPYSISGSTLTVSSTSDTVELPCEPTSWDLEGNTLYAVCANGLLLVSIEDKDHPVALEVVRTADPAQKLFKVGGATWVSTPSGSRPLATWKSKPTLEKAVPTKEPKVEQAPKLEPVPEPVVEPTEPIEPIAVTGRVIAVKPGFAIIDFGLNRDVEDGAHIEFFRTDSVDLGAGQVVQKDRVISVGQIETISESRAKVKLGLNEIVGVGVGARTTDAKVTGRMISPRRVGGVFDTSFLVRPFLALGTLGGGAIIDGSVSYRFNAPFTAEFFLQPFGFGIAERGNILTFAGNVFGSYDTTAFQVGLGVGASKINTLSASRESDFIPGRNSAPTYRTGLSIAQIARLGSRDGLHLRVLNNFVLENEEFNFGGITAEGFVPLRVFVDNAWFLVRGGGGVPGHLFGETGLQLLARGNGGKGSLYFTTTVGFGSITGETYDDCVGYDYGGGNYQPAFPGETNNRTDENLVEGVCRDDFTYGGPLVGFGMSFRL